MSTPNESPAGRSVVPLRPPARVATMQGTLALDLQPHHDPPEPWRAPVCGETGGDVVPIDRRQRRYVEQWAHRYAQAAAEIVGGDRPLSQLLRWSSPTVYADLDRRSRLVAHAGAHQPGLGRVQPVRPHVLSVHICVIDPVVVEAGVHLRYGPRSRALAARFELRATRRTVEPRWICTALDFA